MAVGTIAIGISGYGFLSLIGHGRFDDATLAALSSTYLLMNILGPGVYLATEQETSRRVSAGIAGGLRVSPVVQRLVVITAAITLLTLLVLAAVAPTLLDDVLDGQVALFAALVIALIGSALVFSVRGLAGGQRRFRVYAWSLIIDGGVRLTGCVTLALVGSHSPGAFALVFSAGPVVAAAVCVWPARLTEEPRRSPAPAAGWASMASRVGWLLVASALTMALANIAPVIVTATLSDDAAAASAFAIALVLSRVPLLLMSPVQALVLPGLAASASEGRVADFRRQFGRGLSVVAVLGAAFLIGGAVAGPRALQLLFGTPEGAISVGVLEALMLSAIGFMIIQLCQPALIALHLHAGLVAGWVAGAIAFGMCFSLPIDPISRAVLAQLLAPATVLAVHGTLIVRGLRRLGEVQRVG
jgi:O-antigen/teichoic acid export membrane protein